MITWWQFLAVWIVMGFLFSAIAKAAELQVTRIVFVIAQLSEEIRRTREAIEELGRGDT